MYCSGDGVVVLFSEGDDPDFTFFHGITISFDDAGFTCSPFDTGLRWSAAGPYCAEICVQVSGGGTPTTTTTAAPTTTTTTTTTPEPARKCCQNTMTAVEVDLSNVFLKNRDCGQCAQIKKKWSLAKQVENDEQCTFEASFGFENASHPICPVGGNATINVIAFVITKKSPQSQQCTGPLDSASLKLVIGTKSVDNFPEIPVITYSGIVFQEYCGGILPLDCCQEWVLSRDFAASSGEVKNACFWPTSVTVSPICGSHDGPAPAVPNAPGNGPGLLPWPPSSTSTLPGAPGGAGGSGGTQAGGGAACGDDLDLGAADPDTPNVTWFTLYMHMDSIFVSLNDTVRVGDVIGEVGTVFNPATGALSTGPHLHYGAYVQNKPVQGIGLMSIPLKCTFGLAQKGSRDPNADPPFGINLDQAAAVYKTIQKPIDDSHCSWFNVLGSPAHGGLDFNALDLNCDEGPSATDSGDVLASGDGQVWSLDASNGLVILIHTANFDSSGLAGKTPPEETANLTISGSAGVVSNRFTAKVSGGLNVSGTVAGQTISPNWNYASGGSITLGGEWFAYRYSTADLQRSRDNLSLGGSAIVTSTTWGTTGDGGLTVGGNNRANESSGWTHGFPSIRGLKLFGKATISI